MATWLERLVGGVTGETGAKAAVESGKLQAEAITEASRIQSEASDRAIAQLIDQLGITREQFAPFLEAGTGAIGDVESASTVAGLESLLGEIMGGEAFQNLVDERGRAISGQLGAGGLTRSGMAITEGARIPTDLAFQIENLLTGRKRDLVGVGQSAAAQESGITGNLTTQIMNAIMGGAAARGAGITGAATATATGILGGAQSEQQGIQNLLNLGGTIAAAKIGAG